MVRAILAGNKTQTRRVMKPQPWSIPGTPYISDGWMWTKQGHGDGDGLNWGINASMDKVSEVLAKYCPHGRPGDRLWVREPVGIHCRPEDGIEGYCVYRADFPDGPLVTFEPHWTPAMHMPRWASRITLEITGVRVQRLQDITEEDAIAEGMETIPVGTATWSNRQSFATLWDQLNGKREGCAWENNPWVWAIKFLQYR
jgi:hypothetical protein